MDLKPITMEIKILGTGCPKCKALEQQTINALAELDIEADVQKEEDIVKIMNYGVMRTPGLVINGKVVLSGQVASKEGLKKIILENK